ncbi:hypothetical protein Tsubulata_040922 [Turnera subulata]|uniref:F-box domain-containing protein n=1 Tax=Turnera subulata TaxID=218843 RepID=A0A9Q0GDK1_9ROSI|nr:hypothetical protein Tsubulata_040922 [Turnera subulata]
MDAILRQNQHERHKKKHKRHKKNKTCSFSSLDDLLCDELLEQILCRVELKTIYRCKSVCKRWLSTISSPEFIKRYVGFQQSVTPISSRFYLAFDLQRQGSRYSSNYRLDICKEEASSSSSSSFKFDLCPKHPTGRPSSLDLVGAWNGLLLFREETFSRGDSPRYHVCNPITMDWLVLPLPPPPRPCRYFPGSYQAAFIDDDDRSITTTGGVPSGFKVVLIDKQYCHFRYLNVSIFSTSTGEWRRRRAECTADFYIDKGGLVCCNRLLYWVAEPMWRIRRMIRYNPYKPSDKCSYIELPISGRYKSKPYIGVNQGRIMVCNEAFNQRSHLRIWELQDWTTGSWCLKHNLVLYSVRLNLPVSDYRILAIHPIDDIVYLEQREDQTILSLNMKNKSKQEVVAPSLPEDPEAILKWRQAFPFFLPWWQTRLPDLNNLKQT